MDDRASGRNTGEVVERRLAPLQERVAILLALEFETSILSESVARPETVDLDRMIDDQLHRLERIDRLRVAAHRRHRVAHRRQVDDDRDAGEILEQHARRAKGDFALAWRLRRPA